MQSIVNKTTKKQVKYLNLEDSDEEEKPEQDSHKDKMREGGFTLIEEGDDHIHSKKAKVDDGNHTTMLGIKREHAEKIMEEAVKKGKFIVGKNEDVPENLPNKRRKTENGTLYGFVQKDVKKQELLKLREDFEMYKTQMSKMHSK